MDSSTSMDPRTLLEEACKGMNNLREIEEKGDTCTQRFFEDKVVFVTGGTGFLGKQLIEKLLRSCFKINKIYLLVREKRGVSAKDRLREQLKDPVYDELRQRYPGFEEKIHPVYGDVSEMRLGISNQDWTMITKKTNVIFHVAATVRFDEPLRRAVLVNVRGTREAIKLGLDCTNLTSFVHFSTAYSFCYLTEIEEKVYKTPVTSDALLNLVENSDPERVNFENLLKDWPNTYTMSKAMAEELVQSYNNVMPICIVRPAIVLPAYREPAPGWVDITNASGPSGILLGSGMGLLKIIWAESSVNLDIVPVDYVNNLAIVAACETAKNYNEKDNSEDVKVYTLSRFRNPLSLKKIQDFLEHKARHIATPRAIWYCYAISISNYYLYSIAAFFMHTIPALFLDIILTLVGSKYRLKRIFDKAHKMNSLLSYFVFHSWQQRDDNTLALYEKLPHAEKEVFNFDIANMDFSSFMYIWCIGLRKYLIKDGLKGTKFALKKQFWLKIANFVFLVLYGTLLFKVVAYSYSFFSFFFSALMIVACYAK